MGENEIQEIRWPKTKDVPCEVLARKIAEFCQELNTRQREPRERTLEAALKIWPQLHNALRATGRKVGLNDLAEPVMPGWANEPVVPLEGAYEKPKTKQKALEIALTVGDGGWATIGELWLWVGGGGPIVDRTLQKYGYKKP